MRKLLLILFFLPFFASAQTPMNWLIGKRHSSSCDADATAFLTATGITDPTESAAICELVKDLKDSSLWTSMQAIYPMVGGTSTTCKYNLKDPQNTDGAFRLTFNAGWSFASTGATPNGSTGFAETHYIPNTHAASNSSHMSYYSRTQGSGGENMIEMGASDGGGAENQLIIRFSNNSYYEPNSVVSGYLTVGNTDARGFYVASRIASNNLIGQKNLTQITGTASQSLMTYQTYIGGRNNSGGLDFPSNRECAFATIGAGLSSAQLMTLYRIVQEFQTTLGRQM